MSNKLCISTTVDEKYQYYMPLFVLSLSRSYPEYDIKLFTHGKIKAEVKKALKIAGGNCCVVSGVFSGWAKHKYSPISWRFLVPPKHYEGYDYVYVTDIDMMITKEKVSLLKFHKMEMEKTGLCYSNSLRNAKHWKGRQSLSGLHFFNRIWLKKTEKARKRYATLVKQGAKGRKREFDGAMLYKMAKKSKVGISRKYSLVRRHHGIHLGSSRLFTSKYKIQRRIDRAKCKRWLKLKTTDEYKRIYELISDTMVKKQLKWLDAHCRRVLKK